MEEQILSWFQSLGFRPEQTKLVLIISESVLLLAAAMLVKLVTRLILVRISERVAARTASTWDDALLQAGFFHRVSNWPPLVLLANFIPLILRHHPEWLLPAQRLLDVAVILTISLIYV